MKDRASKRNRKSREKFDDSAPFDDDTLAQDEPTPSGAPDESGPGVPASEPVEPDVLDDPDELDDDFEEFDEAAEQPPVEQPRRRRERTGEAAFRHHNLILHSDAEILVADKPAGVLAAPGRGPYTLLSDLVRSRAGLSPQEPLRLVHRIDLEASGVVVYARTLAAQQHLVRQFEERRVEKVYFAIVSGYVEGDGVVELPLGFDRRLQRMKVMRSRGKPSVTRYQVVERLAGNTLVECRPLTGRTHQIRVHMAAIGHPLTVDPLYGGAERVLLSVYKPGYRTSTRKDERPLIERLTLHAARVTIEHPTLAERATFEAPTPKDFRAAVSQLGRLKR